MPHHHHHHHYDYVHPTSTRDATPGYTSTQADLPAHAHAQAQTTLNFSNSSPGSLPLPLLLWAGAKPSDPEHLHTLLDILNRPSAHSGVSEAQALRPPLGFDARAAHRSGPPAFVYPDQTSLAPCAQTQMQAHLQPYHRDVQDALPVHSPPLGFFVRDDRCFYGRDYMCGPGCVYVHGHDCYPHYPPASQATAAVPFHNNTGMPYPGHHRPDTAHARPLTPVPTPFVHPTTAPDWSAATTTGTGTGTANSLPIAFDSTALGLTFSGSFAQQQPADMVFALEYASAAKVPAPVPGYVWPEQPERERETVVLPLFPLPYEEVQRRCRAIFGSVIEGQNYNAPTGVCY